MFGVLVSIESCLLIGIDQLSEIAISCSSISVLGDREIGTNVALNPGRIKPMT